MGDEVRTVHVTVTDEDVRRFGLGPVWTEGEHRHHHLEQAKELRRRREEGRKQMQKWSAILVLVSLAGCLLMALFPTPQVLGILGAGLFAAWLAWWPLTGGYPSETEVLTEELKAYRQHHEGV
jgi:hypothetical protein